ncbi:MAG: hypothetical protein H6745_21120 [Deltaproteobacteria bacterium]|nr:hypothetical protein [Deltaproteobacteria bacterium]
MCRRVTCKKCGRPTFAGCGAHIEQVLGDVPRDKRCNCHEMRSASPPSSDGGASSGSWFSRLFGK